MIFGNYKTSSYGFEELIKSILEVKDLQRSHLSYEQEEILGKGKDQSTKIHRKFYDYIDSADEKFTELYKRFITDNIKPIFGEDLVYQKFPTFRAHFPKNVAVFAFHKDKDYNHPEQERNIYLPITDAWDTNTVWAETSEDKGDFEPIDVEYGNFVVWNGNSLNHGSKTNTTGKTRISFDFRVIPLSEYDSSFAKKSISKSMDFTIGGYYEVI